MKKAKFIEPIDYSTKPKASAGMLNKLNYEEAPKVRRTCEVISKKQKKKEQQKKKTLLEWHQDKFEDDLAPNAIDKTIIFQSKESLVEKKEIKLEEIIDTLESQLVKAQETQKPNQNDGKATIETTSIVEELPQTDLTGQVTTIHVESHRKENEQKSDQNSESNILSILNHLSDNNSQSFYSMFLK